MQEVPLRVDVALVTVTLVYDEVAARIISTLKFQTCLLVKIEKFIGLRLVTATLAVFTPFRQPGFHLAVVAALPCVVKQVPIAVTPSWDVSFGGVHQEPSVSVITTIDT